MNWPIKLPGGETCQYLMQVFPLLVLFAMHNHGRACTQPFLQYCYSYNKVCPYFHLYIFAGKIREKLDARKEGERYDDRYISILLPLPPHPPTHCARKCFQRKLDLNLVLSVFWRRQRNDPKVQSFRLTCSLYWLPQ